MVPYSHKHAGTTETRIVDAVAADFVDGQVTEMVRATDRTVTFPDRIGTLFLLDRTGSFLAETVDRQDLSFRTCGGWMDGVTGCSVYRVGCTWGSPNGGR